MSLQAENSPPESKFLACCFLGSSFVRSECKVECNFSFSVPTAYPVVFISRPQGKINVEMSLGVRAQERVVLLMSLS